MIDNYFVAFTGTNGQPLYLGGYALASAVVAPNWVGGVANGTSFLLQGNTVPVIVKEEATAVLETSAGFLRTFYSQLGQSVGA